ncbi:hypothetical protein IID19_04575 [Patescibacteria group bacterium]|nr:hypothetical protein [Patescibacteria group bacterium]
MNKPLIITILFILIIIVGGAYWFMTQNAGHNNIITNTALETTNTEFIQYPDVVTDPDFPTNNNSSTNEGSTDQQFDEHSESSNNTNGSTNTSTAFTSAAVVFTKDMFDVNQVSHITPLGELNGGYIESQTLSGVMINLRLDSNRNADFIDIFAPTDMSLESYAYTDFGGTGDADWSLTFNIAQGVTMIIHHVREAGEKITSATTTTPNTADSHTTNVSPPIAFEAGEYIGRTDGTALAHNWNIYVYDNNTNNKFAKQERYKVNEAGDRMRTATCVFSYYPEDLRKAYEVLYGYSFAGQSATCGQVARDVPGTIAGLWYFSDTPSEGIVQDKDGVYTTPLALYTVSDDTVIIHEVDGRRLDIAPQNNSYIKPSNIITEHCYTLVTNFDNTPAGWAYFKLVDDDTMQLAYNDSGSCPSTFPDDNSKTYYR